MMNSQSNSFAIRRNLSLVVCLLAFGFLLTGKVGAQSAAKVAGELASANRATINGSSAISGMTVFSHNRIRAAERGAAVVNLGKLGRLELGAETDLTLRFSAGNLGGELHSGRAVVSAPAGVMVSVATAKGLVATDGLQAAVLTIEVYSARARVVTHRGKARVVSGGEIERVEEGEEIALEPRGAGWRHRRLIGAGAAGIALAGQLASQAARPAAAATAPTTSSFTSLLGESVKSSVKQVNASKDRDPFQFFETAMSCRDHDNNKCKKKSKKKPKDKDDNDDDNDNGHGNDNKH
jgi:hypothetical protein